MKSFNEFIKGKEKPWNGNPTIGWWKEQDPITLYHGTHESLITKILEQGLNRKDTDTGMISLALEPNTAAGYASMFGGESDFRRAGKRSKHVKEEDRVVFIFQIPLSWILTHMDPKLSRNDQDAFKRMTNKELYENWKKQNKQDQEYYMLCEIRVKTLVPPEFIVGYMIRGK